MTAPETSTKTDQIGQFLECLHHFLEGYLMGDGLLGRWKPLTGTRGAVLFVLPSICTLLLAR